MSSAEVVCFKKMPDITDESSIEANSMDPDQTAPIGAVWSGSRGFWNISADENSWRLLLLLTL